MNNESDSAGATLTDAQQFSGYSAPFQVLILTERDCDVQLAELGISPSTLAADTQSLIVDTAKACRPFKDLPNVEDQYLACAHDLMCARLANDRERKGYWALVACRAALDYFKVLQNERKHELNATAVRLALFAQNMMNIAWRPIRFQKADELARSAVTLANAQQGTNRILTEANEALLPLAAKGDKFNPGKAKGSLSPIPKRIKNYMTRHPDASASDVWDVFANSPGAQFVYCDNTVGQYIEDAKSGKTIMVFSTFRNHVTKHRPKAV
jgi:hypothetical protein